jgi:hypothetical protein
MSAPGIYNASGLCQALERLPARQQQMDGWLRQIQQLLQQPDCVTHKMQVITADGQCMLMARLQLPHASQVWSKAWPMAQAQSSWCRRHSSSSWPVGSSSWHSAMQPTPNGMQQQMAAWPHSPPVCTGWAEMS